STGALAFAAAPDFEAPTDAGANNVYDVTVTANDGAGGTTQQAIAVTVTDVNDAPIFTSPTTTSVAENSTSVLTVATTDADLPAQTLSYSISSGADAAKFTINASTGALAFAAAPDFEAPTDAGANNVYDVTVTANDGAGGTTQQAIAVAVTGVNDNNPVFTSAATANVAENSTTVLTVAATDADLPAQTLSYSISGGADAAKFTINASTGALAFAAAPDFEAPTDAGGNNVYDVTVTANDGAGGTTQQAIAVTVSDANDAPVFTSPTTANVAENSTTVLTVAANDVDLPAQTLNYSISSGADAAKFTINASTGALAFAAAPDFEAPTDAGANNVYDVTVTANDGAGGTTQQAIAVTVTGVNDNSPVITSNGGGATASLSVAENATAVTTVTATDSDVGDSKAYSISGGADAAKFIIDSTTGALAFAAAPDFEAPTDAGGNNVYDVTVTVTDSGTNTDTQAIAVTVTDLNNEVAPVITSNGGGATASLSVAENATAVTTVTATDSDVGDSKTYSISGGADAAKFSINPSTGALAFAASPDFEVPTDADGNNVYDVTVTVTDSGTNTDSQAIAVTVTGVNDNSPVFISGASVNVEENTTFVLPVIAVDGDLPTQSLSYSITGGGDFAKFTINASTGTLAFVAAPDFEAPTDAGGNNVYDVTVTANDGAGGITQQAISVTVTAVNDNNPVFTSAATANVAENSTAVLTVTATDADLPTPTLSYSISGGADSAKFTLNSTSGALAFTAAPNFEAPTDAGGNNVYDVMVTASDGTGRTTQQAIAVTVTDVFDNNPVIQSVSVNNGAYALNENIQATVTFDQIVNVTGAPELALNIGGVPKIASLVTGSGNNTLTFQYTVEAGLTDNDGVDVIANGLSLNGGSITSTSAVAALLTSAAATFAGATVDTTRPTEAGASFTESMNSTESISLSFSEAVTAFNTNGLTLHKNPDLSNGQGGWNNPTVISATGVSGSGTSTLTITTNTELTSTDVVRAYYDATWGNITDLAGNPLSSGEIWFGGSGASVIDLSEYGSNLPITLRGNGGADQLTGDSTNNAIIDGGGADTLTGGRGADTIRLVENGVDSRAYAKDTIVIGLGDSTVNGWDFIRGSGTSPTGTGFDISSVDATKHDVLSLPSNVIAANTGADIDGVDSGAIGKHSISGGIVTFKDASGTAILINQANSSDARSYLSANIHSPGTTVAFKLDGDSNGTIDSLVVFQDNGTIPLSNNFVVPDTVVVLAGLINVANATLGTAAGANVVQLVDTTAPYPVGFALTSNGIALNFAENTFATASVALSLKLNGSGADMAITGITGSGTTAMGFTTGTTLSASDWVLLNYTATSAVNGLSDAGGNFLEGDNEGGYGGSAEGSAGNNTINLSNAGIYSATGGYDINGAGGNDTLTGSAAGDWISGGTGADLMTGGGGSDDFGFEQGDSPAVTAMSLGGNSILDNGDTFTFANGVDRITDLVTGEGLGLNALNEDMSGQAGVGWMGAQNQTPANSGVPSNGLAVDQGFFLTQGNYSGTVFTVNSTGADTLVMYDGDFSGGVTQTGIVLSGVTLAQLNAYSGGNWISHI
ncbi:MAG: cadherin repeat domain-containing protein, partial [Gammaproteobacteria bacterium]|nr:cadherin repeat domain-containing protein [Gammaproteobacteria bacterium]